MIMRILLTIYFFLISGNLFCQDSTVISRKSPWNDSTFISVILKQSSLNTSKVVSYNIGEKAIIYVRNDSLLKLAKISLSNCLPSENKYYTKIVRLLTSNKSNRDTTFINKYLYGFDYLISNQLLTGDAKIFYKRPKLFVDTISHRLEKYGMYAHRFYYLPDGRPFFSVMEYSGIIENGRYFSDPNELMKFAEKARDCMKK